jgi:non-ribosomal peptide synthetase component F
MSKFSKKNLEDLLPLTPFQEGMLFHHLKSPNSGHGFEQVSLEISGEVDVQRFNRAWHVVVRQNEMLRTVFQWEQVNHPLQIILKEAPPQLRFFDFMEQADREKTRGLEEIKAKDREKNFDLRDVPFRVTLCRTGKDRYTMLISNHHILYDGWSSGIILGEFLKAYDALGNREKGKSPLTTPAKTKFKRYLEALQLRDTDAQEKFWENYLEGLPQEKTGVQNRGRRKEITSTGYYRIRLPQPMTESLNKVVKQSGITLAAFFYAVWGVVLQHFNSGSDVVFDTTVSGRNLKLKGIEEMVGLFINTLPLRVNTLPRETIAGFLTRTSARLKQWNQFQDSAPDTVNRYLDLYSGHNLFDSVLVLENYPLDKVLRQKNSTLTVTGYSISSRTRYDLTVLITAVAGITLDFIYNDQLFDEAIMAKVEQNILYVATNFLENPQGQLSSLTLAAGQIRTALLQRLQPGELERREGSPEDRLPPAAAGAAPGDAVEKKLADLWWELFPAEKTAPGIDTNFFDLGGHSIKASLLRKRIEKEFHIIVPLPEIFHSPTVRALARYIRKSRAEGHEPVRAVEEREYYGLSSAQQRMYHLQQSDLHSTAYNVSSFIALEGAATEETAAKIEKIFSRILYRHESLRTSFPLINGKPRQKIDRTAAFSLEEQNLDSCPESAVSPAAAGGAADLRQWCSDFIRPFALARAPLLRVALGKLGETRFLLMVDLHHMIIDAVSMNLFIREFNALYAGEDLPPVQFQYKSFCRWQNQRLSSGQLQQQQDYWHRELSGELPLLNLLTDFRRPPLQSFQGDRVHFVLDSAFTARLNRYLRERETTLFTLLLAAFNVLLHIYTSQEDIIVGSTVAGRNHAELDPIMGLFIETLALRNFPAGCKTAAAFLQEVKERTFTALEHTDYPFGEVIKHAGHPGDLSRNPLFSVMLIVQNVDPAGLDLEGLTCTPVPFTPKVSKLDLTLEAAPAGEEIYCHIEYCTQLFKRETIERMAGHLVSTLAEMMSHPHALLSELEIMSDDEKQRILTHFRENRLLPGEAEEAAFNASRLFRQQVRQNPDAIALVYEHNQFTYRQLADKADHLAAVIRELNPGD